MGATPVFCEVDPRTLLADPADIKQRITPKTRVISPIHRCGRVCDMDALLDICNRHGIVLVEDAAHAHGSEWDGVKIGNLGHIACFSMQGADPGSKPVSSGEGGLIATNDRELYERCLIHAHLHRTGALDELTNPVYRELNPQLLGWKWRAHPLAVALARVSLMTLPYRMAHFAALRDELFEKIQGIPGIEPVHNYPKAKGVELYGGLQFLYDPDALGGLCAERLCEALNAEGVPMRPHGFREPEHLRVIYTKDLPGLWGRGHPGPGNVPLPRYTKGDYPISEGLMGRVLSLSGWIEATDGLIDQVGAAIRKVADGYRKLL
jgi:dTDP-4-amino-4,6-dideoxygalactose transaminase